ncbi:DUF3857 domain-containing protein [Mucilaginibacter boryungensis]|uniref:DUF3857 domain-containing protein n=1 Tax=Mucilaginibacter boryungensis TaxID=768480 RepID=A0ABR9XH38_9SPHI|nr:DUF3857 domain-containing protein [Mucilaginibacter boryungensis]MBE9666586.1 DUF3857 domain-containing protein [Mucilaginibacter boryungensis]
MKGLFLVAGACLLSAIARGQQNYDATLIPKELLAYSTAVIRNCDEHMEVKDLDNTIYHIKQAVTILNKNGDKHAEMAIWHNKSNVIKTIKGAIYTSSGKLLSKFSEKDFEDESAASNSSLFEDSRVKHYQPAIIDYPYTIEFEYELRSKQTLNLFDWRPNPGTGVSVENSTFTFTCKPDFNIRYKEINTPHKVVRGTNPQGLKTYQWQLSNLKSVKYEPYSPNPQQYLTTVKIAPEKFSYEGITGSYSNWKELGKWIYDKLLLNRDAVSAETVDHIKEITRGITDPKLKAQKIYEYMQQKTRYVSIQTGIGGYQPFMASDVDRTGYGDCKALVNYTHALLKTANIDSWYCVVKSGSRKQSFLTDFASMDQGDHVILCLPFKNDTTWLECTSQKIPFGYLGDFTDDRWVLACTPEGGKLLHTPHYATEANITRRKAEFTIDTKGELSGNMITEFCGTDYDTRYEFIDEAYTEQLKRIKEAYPINNLDIEKLALKKASSANAVTTEAITFKAREFASLNTDKFYFKVNLANRTTHVPDEIRNRLTDVYINRGFVEDDQISYILPTGYRPDKVLMNKEVTKPFGKYTISMHLDGNKLVYKRRLQLNEGTYDKDSYQDLVDFYQEVADADTYHMTLVKRN